MRKIILFDIDKTVFNGYTIFPLAEAQLNAGLIDSSVVHQLNQDMNDYKAGGITYEGFVAILLDHWVTGLKNRLYSEILDNAIIFYEKNKDKFFTYVQDIINKYQLTHDVFFVTGEPQFIAEAVSRRYQASGWLSSMYSLDENSRFTGTVEKYLATKQEKRAALAELHQKYDFENSYGFGDSDADIEMLSLVSKPICVNPNQNLLTHATNNNWIVFDPNQVISFME